MCNYIVGVDRVDPKLFFLQLCDIVFKKNIKGDLFIVYNMLYLLK